MFVSWYCTLVRLQDITDQEERRQEKKDQQLSQSP